MLVTARASQGAFGALLAPAALSILSVMFSDRGARQGVRRLRRDRRRGRRDRPGARRYSMEYLTWRWCLYVNLFFAAWRPSVRCRCGAPGAHAAPVPGGPARRRARLGLDVLPGLRVLQRRQAQLAHAVALWFPGAGVALLAFRVLAVPCGQPAAAAPAGARPNRGGAYLAVLISCVGIYGVFLFLTYHLQQTLGYSPAVSARLPADDRDAGVTASCPTSSAARFGRRRWSSPACCWPRQPGVADQDRRGRLRSGGARPAHGGRPGRWLHGRAVDGHRDVRRRAVQDPGVASATLKTGKQVGG